MSSLWFGVALRREPKKTCILKEIGLRAQKMTAIQHSKDNILGGRVL